MFLLKGHHHFNLIGSKKEVLFFSDGCHVVMGLELGKHDYRVGKWHYTIEVSQSSLEIEEVHESDWISYYYSYSNDGVISQLIDGKPVIVDSNQLDFLFNNIYGFTLKECVCYSLDKKELLCQAHSNYLP